MPEYRTSTAPRASKPAEINGSDSIAQWCVTMQSGSSEMSGVCHPGPPSARGSCLPRNGTSATLCRQHGHRGVQGDQRPEGCAESQSACRAFRSSLILVVAATTSIPPS
jgi:hypothetical protein